MRSQTELDRMLAKMTKDYAALNKKQQADAIRNIGRVKGEMSYLLTDYADNEGIIDRRRISRVMRDMDGIERIIREDSSESFDKIIEDTAEWTTAKIVTALGVAWSVGYIMRTNERISTSVENRRCSDLLQLSDRVWDLSGGMRDELTQVVRSSIIRGESVSQMIPKIRRVHDNETWKIRRIAVTEGNTAYRKGTAYNASQSGSIKWVQLHDGTCGHRDHFRHKCYELVNEDWYGQGAGIFKPSDDEILSPHPNCTSYISYVLDERYL